MPLMRSRVLLLALGLLAAAAAHAQSCPEPATWSALDGERPRAAQASALLDRMAQREVVLLGEVHDDADHHRWQLQTLAALHARRPDMAIGFEMFTRRVQPALDRWVAGKLTVKEFLDQSEWHANWNMPAELYLPLFEFARINRIPLLALNIERTLSRAITEKGWDAVPEAEREGVGRPAPPAAAYRDSLFDVYLHHPTLRDKGDKGGKGARPKKSDAAFRFFVESQTAWDRAMAEALARRAGAGKPLVVGVMGSGHLRHGHGVPHQLRDLGVNNVGTLLPLSAGGECKDLRAGLADAVFMLPAQVAPKPAPPRLGVQLEDHEGGVRILAVTAGSLAEQSGLKRGDVILEMAGRPLQKTLTVIALVRLQPAGTWLPLRIKRGEETLELVIKFPPEKS